ncbi:phosphonate C-P lyase system protein PhnH [Desulfosporosinus sp. PR]|uniref:phosphonate C-P lyase system protein PhnH n=1 Tax=Candidatus Desulfosporosinus nitrosoreducens TaxID=3401928 RepID=UPI0027E99474|nr:phosphonate C-P lyase system protein PhnH [Desulfosporosinus sp. PR]MDQ7092532.1 phosphonate C-P lyase system protein PhnH [Desulfosporosinus sp. PR]
MELDLVHDIQAVYRQTLDAMSRPGLIKNIRSQALKAEMAAGCYGSTLVLALMLFDTEVTFKVCSQAEAEITKLISQLTYARAAELASADYILVLQDAAAEDLETAFNKSYPGDLLNPHKGATILIEAEAVSNGRNLRLTGPGIQEEQYIDVKASPCWIDLRAEKNREYPLGVDVMFTDGESNILCLPRTTQIRKQVVG